MFKKLAMSIRKNIHSRPASREPNPVDVYVGERLALLRQMQHLSQQKLADALGITFQLIQKYEKGDYRISCSRLRDFSQVLRVPVKYFFMDMPNSVSLSSPRFILGRKGEDCEAAISSEIYDNQTLEFICALRKISNPRTVEYLYKLILELGKSSYEIKKNSADDF